MKPDQKALFLLFLSLMLLICSEVTGLCRCGRGTPCPGARGSPMEDSLALPPDAGESSAQCGHPSCGAWRGPHWSTTPLTVLPNQDNPAAPQQEWAPPPASPAMSSRRAATSEESKLLENVVPGSFLPPLGSHMSEFRDTTAPCSCLAVPSCG